MDSTFENNYEMKNLKKRQELLKNVPTERHERDIWNMKYLLASIICDSRFFRLGMVSSLRRVIKILEKSK